MNPATEPVGHAALAPEIGPLNALLHSELAAIVTYEQALARFADRPAWTDLRRICHHHRSAAAVLRDQMTNLGGEPETAAVFDSAAPPAGTTITLEALRIEEELRLMEIERVLEREDLPDECRFAIRTQVLPRCHEHIDALIDMAEPARKE